MPKTILLSLTLFFFFLGTTSTNAQSITKRICTQNNVGCDAVGVENIQSFINSLGEGDTLEILLQEGTYRPSRGYDIGIYNSVVDETFSKKCLFYNGKINLKIEGEGNGATIEPSVPLMGLCTDGGASEISNIKFSNFLKSDNCNQDVTFCSSGDTIYTSGDSSVTIKNTEIKGSGRNGLFALDNSVTTLESSIFKENFLSGIEVVEKAKVQGVGVSILYNDDFGLAVFENGNVELKNCIIKNNLYSGILATDYSITTLDQCNIFKNGRQSDRLIKAFGGILTEVSAVVTAKNSIISHTSELSPANLDLLWAYSTNSKIETINSALYTESGTSLFKGQLGTNVFLTNTTQNVDPKFVETGSVLTDLRLCNNSSLIGKNPAARNVDNTVGDLGAYGGPGACLLDKELCGVPKKELHPNCGSNIPSPVVSPTYNIPSPVVSPTYNSKYDLDDNGSVNIIDLIELVKYLFQ